MSTCIYVYVYIYIYYCTDICVNESVSLFAGLWTTTHSEQLCNRSDASEVGNQKLCSCKDSSRTDIVIGNIVVILHAKGQCPIRSQAM